MKYMIHAIHAGDKDDHGFRTNSLVVYGYGNSVHDFSHVRFPGILNNCAACHVDNLHRLPIGDAVQPTTVRTNDLYDPDDDKNMTTTAAVCTACHDDISVKSHMAENGGDFNFILFESQAETTGTGGPIGVQPAGHTNRTDCSSCHG